MTKGIRPARPEDAAAIAAVHVQAWHETYPGLVPPEVLARMTDKARRQRQWANALAPDHPPPGQGIFVAQAEGRVVGFGNCSAATDPLLGAGEIRALYLLRMAQRRGLGRGLMRAMAGWLLAAGLEPAGLWVLDGNWPARRFYAALGGTPGPAKASDGMEERAILWPSLARLALPAGADAR